MRARKGNVGGRGRAQGFVHGDVSRDRAQEPSARRRTRGKQNRQPGVEAAPVERTLRSSGVPLSAELRVDLERRMGGDLSGVRVHTDDEAREAAAAMHARAFTVGRDIVFNAGEFRPESPAGRKLLAHELAHTMQPSDPASSVSRPNDGAEREADHIARAVARGDAVAPARVSARGSSVNRCPTSARRARATRSSRTHHRSSRARSVRRRSTTSKRARAS